MQQADILDFEFPTTMKYLDVINNCTLTIENRFKEFALTLKNIGFFSELTSSLSSHSFVNEFQLVDITLSFYIPELKNCDEEGVDISIGLFQVRETRNEGTSYTSKIQYDKNHDLIFDKFLYVCSDICTTMGAFVLNNADHVISIDNVYSFEQDLSKAIDNIFIIFSSNIELISTKLLDLKNCT